MTSPDPPYAAIRAALLAHYRLHARDLPWRRTRDPYAIWVSEIMLQQTQVETVIPRFEAFLARFPTLAALSSAPLEAVIDAWAGLGYYRRARGLHQGAQAVTALHQGQVPASLTDLLSLPGVGRYTAGAIGSIAFGLPLPIVDGNVARVASRLFLVEDAADTPAGKRALWSHAEALVCTQDPGALNQALMELGALICRPQRPHCLLCPVAKLCAARKQGLEADYPRRTQRAKTRPLEMAMALVSGQEGLLLMRRPTDKGLWAGLWEPPSAEGPGAKAQLAARLGIRLGSPLATVFHTLTHREVTATLYAVAPKAARKLLANVSGDQMRITETPLTEPLSALARKLVMASMPNLQFDQKAS